MAKICPFCDSENPDSAKFCTGCGAPLAEVAPTDTSEGALPQSAAQPENQVPEYQEQKPLVNSSFTPPYYIDPVPPYPIGGLLAWSIVVILLCLIPGIVALVQVLGINKAQTIEEQQKKISSAKIWLIVGTVLGVLSLAGGVGSRMM